MTDEELVACYLAGDEAALAQLADRYLPRLTTFAGKFCMYHPESAEDIAQEAFVKAWRALGSFDQSASFKSWIYRITQNTGVDWTRKKREALFSHMTVAEGVDYVETLLDERPTPSDRAIANEKSGWVRAALQQLPALYIPILTMRYEQDRSFENIAAELNRSVNTVRSQHRRGLGLLRTLLADSEQASY